MAGYRQDSGQNQRRLIAFAAIIALHIFIGWAFITGFGQSMVAQAQKILETTIIKQDEAKETPPPPPKPDLRPPPPPSVPIPLITVNVPVDAPIVVTRAPPPPAAPPRPAAIVAQTPIKTLSQPDCGEEYYPSQAKRLQQEGTVVVKFCVGEANKIDGPVEIMNSSGFPELDQAAGKCLAAGRYRAGSVEGKPTRLCKSIKVTYKLKGQ